MAAAAALALGGLGFGASVASAQVAIGPARQVTTTTVTSTAPAETSTFAITTTSVLGGKIVVPSTYLAVISAGATGDGPADQEECDRHAGLINTLIQEAQSQDNENDTNFWLNEASEAANQAMDRGCFLY